MFQSPQRGLFISYTFTRPTLNEGNEMSFSPLSGDCLFLTSPPAVFRCTRVTFQSPQRGLFISYPLRFSRRWNRRENLVSVPSAGIVYFLRFSRQQENQIIKKVSVPSAGIVYFLHKGEDEHGMIVYSGFSPLSGDCLFLTYPVRSQRSA